MPVTTPAGRLAPAARILAWLAGAAFVASLAYFLWFYVVELGRPAQAGRGFATAIALDAGLFALFAVHHTAMARAGAKRWLARRLPPAHERTLYVWVASALFFAVCWWWQDLPGRLYRTEGWATLPFRLAQLAGIGLALGSARAIDVFDLAGIRQARSAAVHGAAAHVAAPGAPGHLETGGAYRLVRHPIYLGTLLLMAATPDLTAGRLLFTVLSLIYLVVGVAFEERSLLEEFGPAYEAYCARVRWRIIPGVY